MLQVFQIKKKFMKKNINTIISKLKGEAFIIDPGVPKSYLFRFFLSKAISLLYGMALLHTTKRVFVNPRSIVKCVYKIQYGKNLSIDRGCYVDALSVEGIKCGENVSIGKNTCIECSGSLKYLGKGMCIGNNVGLGTHGYYGAAGGIEIGNETIIGNFVSFHSENHKFDSLEIPIRLQGVSHQGIKIGNNCWIGAKSTFLDGSKIGDGCIVAAGAVIRSEFPDNCIIGGVPAKILKYRQQ